MGVVGGTGIVRVYITRDRSQPQPSPVYLTYMYITGPAFTSAIGLPLERSSWTAGASACPLRPRIEVGGRR